MAAKKEAKDIQEQYDNYKDEMAELQETIELSALDKEMAEERVTTNLLILSKFIRKVTTFTY